MYTKKRTCCQPDLPTQYTSPATRQLTKAEGKVAQLPAWPSPPLIICCRLLRLLCEASSNPCLRTDGEARADLSLYRVRSHIPARRA